MRAPLVRGKHRIPALVPLVVHQMALLLIPGRRIRCSLLLQPADRTTAGTRPVPEPFDAVVVDAVVAAAVPAADACSLLAGHIGIHQSEGEKGGEDMT